MKGLPEGMKPDRDNQVYFDTERGQYYIISWEDVGNRDIPTRYYIPPLPVPFNFSEEKPPKKKSRFQEKLEEKAEENRLIREHNKDEGADQQNADSNKPTK